MATPIDLKTSNLIQHSNFQTTPLKKFIGDLILRPHFLPLCDEPSKAQRARMQEKKIDIQHFWDNVTQDAKFSDAPDIRKVFSRRFEKIPMRVNNKNLEVLVKVIETEPSNPAQPFYQMAYGLNNRATVDTYIEGVVPFLRDYLHIRKDNPSTPPARIFLISVNSTVETDKQPPDNSHHPDSLDEAGLIFSNTLKALTEKYKTPISLLVMHSVSSFILAYAADYGVDVENVCVDRGASTVRLLSENYILGMMGFMPLADYCGWSGDVGSQVLKLTAENLVISGVDDDLLFPKGANLCQHNRVRKAAGFPIIPLKLGVNLFKLASAALGALGLFTDNPPLIMAAYYVILLGNKSSKKALEDGDTSQIEESANSVKNVILLYFKFLPKTHSPSKQHIMPLDEFHQGHLRADHQEQSFLEGQTTLSKRLLQMSIPTPHITKEAL